MKLGTMPRHMVRVAVAVGLLVTLALMLPPSIRTSEPSGDRTPVAWPLACRLASYGNYQDAAWTHLPAIGIHHVFMSVPRPENMAAAQKQLGRHHLKPLVMRGHTRPGTAGQRT